MGKKKYKVVLTKVYSVEVTFDCDLEKLRKDNPKKWENYTDSQIIDAFVEENDLFDRNYDKFELDSKEATHIYNETDDEYIRG